MPTRTPAKKSPTMQERALAYMKADEKLLEKQSLKKMIVVLFPQHKKPPMLGRVAVWLLKKSGGRIDIQFFDTKK